MAPFSRTVTRAVTIRTLLVYVLNLRSTTPLSDVEWTQLLESQGASSTLSFMETYWVSNDGNNEAFWEVWPAYVSFPYLIVLPSTSGPPVVLATVPWSQLVFLPAAPVVLKPSHSSSRLSRFSRPFLRTTGLSRKASPQTPVKPIRCLISLTR
jgi:hypothetical protein